MTEYKPFDSADFLENDEDRRAFLQTASEQDPGDGSLVRNALAVVARSKSKSQIAKDAGITRVSLYKALDENAKPRFETVCKTAKALGYKVCFVPI